MRAAELVLSRIWPIRKGGRTMALDLHTLADAVGAGDLTPDEGQAVAAILKTKRRAIETSDLLARVMALEEGRK